MKKWPLGLKVGILGGGQLALMLAQSAQRLGFSTLCLVEDEDAPATRVSRWTQDLAELVANVDVLTFESEFFALEQVEQKLAQTEKRVWVFPSIQSMRNFSDRRLQKQALVDAGIATSPFIAINQPQDLAEAMAAQKNSRWVFKQATHGYDGNGTFVVQNEAEAKALLARRFQPGIVEDFIAFERELAIIVVRSDAGEINFLPLVETKQKDNRCDWVQGPVEHAQLPELKAGLSRLVEKWDYRGVLAAELFATGSGDLVVNELAPRVHNSGHYSQNALPVSQFDLHWLGGLGLPLAQFQFDKNPNFVMVNLVGESSQDFQIPTNLTGALHWYGKLANRAGRKMGHLNYWGQAPAAELLARALQERERIKK